LADRDVVAKGGGDSTLDVCDPCNRSIETRNLFRRIDTATRHELPRTRTCTAVDAETS